MIEIFKNLTDINILEKLPEVLKAGDNAGYLTEEGARLLDVSGELFGKIPCILLPCSLLAF